MNDYFNFTIKKSAYKLSIQIIDYCFDYYNKYLFMFNIKFLKFIYELIYNEIN